MKTLTFNDFTEYAHQNKLGRIMLPNGRVKIFGRRARSGLSVKLAVLNKMVGQVLIKYGLTTNNVVALIAIGSAILYPGFREVYIIQKKFALVGPRVIRRKNVPIQPNDIDFFIITDKNLGYNGTYLKKGMIHLIGRGLEQITQYAEVNDSLSMHALRDGVPVCFDHRLLSLADKINIRTETPRKIYWNEGNRGIINGIIK